MTRTRSRRSAISCPEVLRYNSLFTAGILPPELTGVQRGDYISEDDNLRFDDDYGRSEKKRALFSQGDKYGKEGIYHGITGQDGSYLAELLLSKGYEVHGLVRRSSTFNRSRIDHIYVDPHDPEARLFLHYGDLADSEQITDIIYNIKPDEVYHLGAQSHVRVSFDMPEYTANITALGTTRILEAVPPEHLPGKVLPGIFQ